MRGTFLVGGDSIDKAVDRTAFCHVFSHKLQNALPILVYVIRQIDNLFCIDIRVGQITHNRKNVQFVAAGKHQVQFLLVFAEAHQKSLKGHSQVLLNLFIDLGHDGILIGLFVAEICHGDGVTVSTRSGGLCTSLAVLGRSGGGSLAFRAAGSVAASVPISAARKG